MRAGASLADADMARRALIAVMLHVEIAVPTMIRDRIVPIAYTDSGSVVAILSL